MNAFLTKDHHNKQRLHALRGYAKHADRLDDRAPINWLHVALVMALALGIAYATGVHLAVAEAINGH